MVDKTTLSISEDVVRVTVAEDVTTISIAPTITKIEAKGIAISSAAGASGTTVQPYGTITATNVQSALEQLADQDFRSTGTPTGTNVSEGDTWYDTDDNEMKVYREVSTGVFAWTNLVVTNTSEVLDAGAF
jgi:hypothetical protein|tara:strand:- start:380 stop:772 length:393 start_codon:yes stop_codon:yes gene_type:complete